MDVSHPIMSLGTKLLLVKFRSPSHDLRLSMTICGLVFCTLTYTFDTKGMLGFMDEVMSQRNTCRLVYCPAMLPSVSRKSSIWQLYTLLVLVVGVMRVKLTDSGTDETLAIPSMPELLLYHT